MKSLLFLLVFIIFSQPVSALVGCVPTADSDSHIIHCKMIVGNYPRPVHVYIPESIQKNESLKVLLHFHGHNLAGYDHFYRTKNTGEGYGDYAAFLLKSKINGVLIIPESLGNCSTYDSFFADPIRTSLFLNSLEKIIDNEISTNDRQWIISGHSGAYRVLNKLAGYFNQDKTGLLQNVLGIGLFDATYGNVSNIELWIKNKGEKNEDFIFYNSYVSGAKATAEPGSVRLQKILREYHSDKIFLKPLASKSDSSVLDQHFSVLKVGGLTSFWQRFSL